MNTRMIMLFGVSFLLSPVAFAGTLQGHGNIFWKCVSTFVYATQNLERVCSDAPSSRKCQRLLSDLRGTLSKHFDGPNCAEHRQPGAYTQEEEACRKRVGLAYGVDLDSDVPTPSNLNDLIDGMANLGRMFNQTYLECFEERSPIRNYSCFLLKHPYLELLHSPYEGKGATESEARGQAASACKDREPPYNFEACHQARAVCFVDSF